MVLNTLLRRKVRTLLTTLGISVGLLRRRRGHIERALSCLPLPGRVGVAGRGGLAFWYEAQ